MILVGLALCCSGLFVCQTMTNRAIGHAAGKARAAAVGLYVTFYYTGGFVGSLVPSGLWRWHQWLACAIFIASILAMASVFVLAVWRKVEPPSVIHSA
jgi:ABC-type Fe3+-siderophore transport system permease subunit